MDYVMTVVGHKICDRLEMMDIRDDGATLALRLLLVILDEHCFRKGSQVQQLYKPGSTCSHLLQEKRTKLSGQFAGKQSQWSWTAIKRPFANIFCPWPVSLLEPLREGTSRREVTGSIPMASIVEPQPLLPHCFPFMLTGHHVVSSAINFSSDFIAEAQSNRPNSLRMKLSWDEWFSY